VSDQEQKPKRIRIDQSHTKKAPEDLMSKEQRAEISRTNGRRSNGPITPQYGISPTERTAIKALNAQIAADNAADRAHLRHLSTKKALDAAAKLGDTGFRVRPDIRGEGRDAARDLGSTALSQMAMAMMGRLSKEKINAVLKASMAVREEVCEPLVKETKLTGALTLEQLVSQAAAKAKSLKGST
jgi:hypothetical protein